MALPTPWLSEPMDTGGRGRNELHVLHGSGGEGRGEAQTKNREMERKDAGREQKVNREDGACVEPLGSGEERAGSPSQGPAGAASQARRNENLLTTRNC